MISNRLLRHFVALAVLVPASLSLQGCDCYLSSSEDRLCSVEQQQTAQLRLSADPASITLAPSTSSTVRVGLTGGKEEEFFTLRSAVGSASGLSVTGTPTAITGTGSAFVTIAALPSAPVDGGAVFTLAVVRGTTEQTTTQLAVTFAPAFSVAAAGVFSGERGDTLSGSLAVSRFQGFVAPIDITIESSSPGIEVDVASTASFGVDFIPLALRVSPTAALGLYTVRLRLKYEATERDVILAGQIVGTTLPPDFVIATLPDTIQLQAGDSASALLRITRSAPGIGPVTFAATGLPAGTNSSFTPVAVNDTTRLKLVTSATTPAGTFPIVLVGTADTLVRRDTLVLVVADPPALSVTMSPRTIRTERLGVFSVAVAATLTGSTAPVTFDAPNSPAGFNVSLIPGAANTATMAVTIGTTVAPATYYLRARASSGTLTAVDSVEVIVGAPAGDFSIALPPSITLEAGATTFAPINLTRSGTMIGAPVALSVSPIPSGGNAWPAPSRTFADTSSLQIIGGNPGTFPLIVTAAGGGIVRLDTIVVLVTPGETPNFFLTPVQKDFNLTRGQFQNMQLTVGRIFGHSGVVTLSALTDDPGNYDVQFSPTATGPMGNTTVNVQLYASPNVPAGPHLLILRGTSGGVTRTALVTLLVF